MTDKFFAVLIVHQIVQAIHGYFQLGGAVVQCPQQALRVGCEIAHLLGQRVEVEILHGGKRGAGRSIGGLRAAREYLEMIYRPAGWWP